MNKLGGLLIVVATLINHPLVLRTTFLLSISLNEKCLQKFNNVLCFQGNILMVGKSCNLTAMHV